MTSSINESDLGDLLELYSGSEVKFDALEDETELERICGICNENLSTPRFLSCLHEFCEECLTELAEEGDMQDKSKKEGEATFMKPKPALLECPKCKQTTMLGSNGIKGLALDLIAVGPLEAPPKDANGSSILCTSCKAKEPAVGRCEDCSNFLCNNCFTAHKYMRVLENHRILTLEELQASGQVSPPPKYFPCPRHTDKSIEYFCLPCQEACCFQCLNRVHSGPDHKCDSAQVASSRFRTEIPLLGIKAKSSLDDCKKIYRQLEASFGQMEEQKASVKKVVEDAFQVFRAVLENVKESVLGQIDEKHKVKELKVMDDLNKLQTRMNKIETAEAFTGRLVEYGEDKAAALVQMYFVLRDQLVGLANPLDMTVVTPKPIKFTYNKDAFEQAVKSCVSTFIEDDNKSPSPVLGPLPIGILHEEETHILPQGLLSPETRRSSPVHLGPIQRPSQSTSLSPDLGPVSAPAASISSVPSLNDIQALTSALASTDLTNGYPHRTPTPDLTNQLGLRSIHQAYNVAVPDFNMSSQFGNYVDKERPMHGRQVGSPTLGPPTGAMTLADLIAGVESNSTLHAMNNLQALVQLNAAQSNQPPQPNSMMNMRAPAGPHMGMSNSAMPTGLGSYPNLLNGLSNPPPPVPSTIRLPSSFKSSTVSMSSATSEVVTSTTMSDVMQRWGEPPVLQKPMDSSILLELSNSPMLDIQNSDKLVHLEPKAHQMSVRIKFGSQGSMSKGANMSCLASPHGFCLGPGEQIFVADTQNHNIKVYDINGLFLFSFGSAGQEDGHFWYPRKLAYIRLSNLLVICDRGADRTRVQLFTVEGSFVRKLRVNYIDIIASVTVNRFGHIIAVDSNNPAIYQIDGQGNLKSWVDCKPYMKEPSDICVFGNEYYVCDFKGHCICVFSETGQFLRKIGGEPLTMFPNGIDISDAGDLLVCDSHGNRFHVVVFTKEGQVTARFECPHLKVSRCCGLNITREGYLVTLAKNNHQVLVMNTLYVQ